MLRVSILSIGDELCIGQVVNTNAAWMADQCSMLGAQVHTHRTVGDDAELMLQTLRELAEQSDVILMTGGLGPTHDDITKDVLCQYFDDKLVEDAQTLAELERLFQERQRPLTERNRAQALVPSKARPLSNAYGSAPGLLLVKDHCLYVAMPGVPNEMKAIMNAHVLAELRARLESSGDDCMMFRTLSLAGIAESSLADLLGAPAEFLEGQQLAFLPSYSGVRLRVSVHAENLVSGEAVLARIEAHIRAKAEKYIVAQGRDNLSIAVHNAFVRSGKTLALAESCTGGMLSAQFTDNPGSSAYFLGGVVCYSNESKIRDLGVESQTLEKHGAVSREVVEELARNVRERFRSDYSVAISGIAGPDGGSEEKPVGTVWIAVADNTGVQAQLHNLGRERAANRERACAAAQLELLRRLQH